MIPKLTVLMLAALLLPCACHRESTEPSERNAPPLEAGRAPGGFVVNPKSGLRTLEVGSGSRAFILLHGYGASPEEWIPFTETIRVSRNLRFVFPEAHESTTPPDGPAGGRAWWRLDLARYVNRGEPIPDLSGSRPEGIDISNQKVRALLRDLETRLGASDGPPILGGYSQGAMIAADVAFTTDEPLKALVILSGTFVDEAGWTKGMAHRKGLPVFICHGETDDILQYKIAIRLRDAMEKAGLRVTWVPFDGGHEVPAKVVTALNTFLDDLD
jgi:phospholipase/carboxylesterase